VVADAKVIDLGGYLTPLTVGYDANGKVVQITYPSGDVVKVARTTDGLITAITETPSGGIFRLLLPRGRPSSRLIGESQNDVAEGRRSQF